MHVPVGVGNIVQKEEKKCVSAFLATDEVAATIAFSNANFINLKKEIIYCRYRYQT